MTSGKTTDHVGREVSPDEQQQLAALQGVFKPDEAMKRVNDFAKWIFATVAVVGTLGAGFSNAAFQTLSDAGRFVLAGAVLLVGLSLYAATRALEPQWMHTNLASRDSMLAAIEGNLRRRRRPLQAAAALFALALVLAALAPLANAVSAWARSPQVALNYEWKADGKLSAQLVGVGLKAYAPVELSVETAAATPLEQVRTRRAVDTDGKAHAALDVALSLPPATALRLIGQWADAPGASALVYKQTLNISVPLAKPATVPSDKTPKTDSPKNKAAGESK